MSTTSTRVTSVIGTLCRTWAKKLQLLVPKQWSADPHPDARHQPQPQFRGVVPPVPSPSKLYPPPSEFEAVFQPTCFLCRDAYVSFSLPFCFSFDLSSRPYSRTTSVLVFILCAEVSRLFSLSHCTYVSHRIARYLTCNLDRSFYSPRYFRLDTFWLHFD